MTLLVCIINQDTRRAIDLFRQAVAMTTMMLVKSVPNTTSMENATPVTRVANSVQHQYADRRALPLKLT